MRRLYTSRLIWIYTVCNGVCLVCRDIQTSPLTHLRLVDFDIWTLRAGPFPKERMSIGGVIHSVDKIQNTAYDIWDSDFLSFMCSVFTKATFIDLHETTAF